MCIVSNARFQCDTGVVFGRGLAQEARTLELQIKGRA